MEWQDEIPPSYALCVLLWLATFVFSLSVGVNIKCVCVCVCVCLNEYVFLCEILLMSFCNYYI